jgi:hypothetical protein
MEVAVRLIAPQPASWLAIYRDHPVLPYALQPGVHALIDTGDSRWTVHTDEHGFRVPERAAGPSGPPILLWLGDSFTFGYGVDFEKSFVGLLALDRNARHRHIDAAVGGYGPTQYRQMLEYLFNGGFRPAAVIIPVFLGNDFDDTISDKKAPVRNGILGDDGGLKSFFKRHFHLYRLVAAARHRLHPTGVSQGVLEMNADARAWTDGPLRQADAIFRQEFERIGSICRSQAIDLRVLLIPGPGMVDSLEKGTSRTADGARDQSLPRKHALSALRDLQISFLDLTPMLVEHPVTETYFFFDGHFTPRGHQLVKDAVAREWPDLLQH